MVDSDDRESSSSSEADAVAQLIRTAGRRQDPPSATYELVLAATTAAWQARVRRRAWHRGVAICAAAALVAAVGLVIVRGLMPAVQPIVARTDRIVGTLEKQTRDGTWTAIAGPGVELRDNDRVRTRDGNRAGVLLGNGASLRLADATEIRFESSRSVRVITGRIYIDTGAAERATHSPVEIVTPLATATDIGTQFEVLYRGSDYRLRVREGRVRLQNDSGSIEGDAGEQVTLDTDGTIGRARVPADHAEWAWAQELAPSPQFDGRSVSVLLAWVARETGKPVRFETLEAERKARTTILHGSAGLLTPLDALSVLLATTDLESELTDDEILIRLKQYR